MTKSFAKLLYQDILFHVCGHWSWHSLVSVFVKPCSSLSLEKKLLEYCELTCFIRLVWRKTGVAHRLSLSNGNLNKAATCLNKFVRIVVVDILIEKFLKQKQKTKNSYCSSPVNVLKLFLQFVFCVSLVFYVVSLVLLLFLFVFLFLFLFCFVFFCYHAKYQSNWPIPVIIMIPCFWKTQVEDVDKMFADLDKLKANNWKKEEVKVQKKPKKVLNKVC